MSDPSIQLNLLRQQRDTIVDPMVRAALDAAIAALEAQSQREPATTSTEKPQPHQADTSVLPNADQAAPIVPPAAPAPNPGQMRSPSVPPDRGSTHSMVIDKSRVDVAIAGNVIGDVNYVFERSKSATELLQGYLDRQIARCSLIPLQGFRDQMAADDVINIKLDQTYTQITTVQSKQSIIRAIATNKTLVVLGEPGGGKSTILRFLTLHLSRAGLDTAYDLRQLDGWEELASLDDDEQYDLLDGTVDSDSMSHMRLLPIFLPLLPLSRRIAQHADAVDYSDQLWSYIAEDLEGEGRQPGLSRVVHDELEAAEHEAKRVRARRASALSQAEAALDLLNAELTSLGLALNSIEDKNSASFQEIVTKFEENQKLFLAKQAEVEIRQRLVAREPKTWRVLLLLDGLDEIGSDTARQEVVRAVQAFSQSYPQCRVAVTCRVRAYEGDKNAKWRLVGWPVMTLADWTLEQMRQYIKAWYLAAADVGNLTTAVRDERLASLDEAIATRADLQRLGARPLLLTIMSLVHFNDARLAENRAALYRRCIDILLGQWELRKGKSEFGTIMDYIGMPNGDVKLLRPLLQRAAFLAQSADTPDTYNALGRAELREMVAQVLAEQKHLNPWEGATLFLTYIDERAGILQSSESGKSYIFPHQTFQEYLAGLELVSSVDFVAQVMQRRDQERWRLPIILGMNHLVSEGALAMPYQLLSELLLAEEDSQERHQRNLIFAAELGSDVSWDVLDRGGSAFKALRKQISQALVPALEEQTLRPAERIRVGALLGNVGDLRLGVCNLPPAAVRMTGGTFFIGETALTKMSDDEINKDPLTLRDFQIARYPITNAQYQKFVDADGYDSQKPWWQEDARRWLLRERRRYPSFWKDERLGSGRPNYPVVGVTWFEAVAFCRWLSQDAAKSPTNIVYRLPTEAEWEFVARGITRRLYPWGSSEPDGECANYEGLYSGTSAVGCFSRGATPEGVQDLAGNVWEWTCSIYAPYPYRPDDGREQPESTSGRRIVARGGSWNTRAVALRASGRNNLSPTYQSNALGFRIAWDVPTEAPTPV